MTQPLALVVYEKLLPGSQLANRLRDLKYRVQTIADAGALLTCARQEKPMLVLIDLVSARHNLCEAISRLRNDPDTRHIPVIAFAPESNEELHQAARNAGAAIVTGDTTILPHLSHFLEQALQIE